MNLENTETIVDRMDADYLWHSTVALRRELEKKEKELKRVIAAMQS
jgi:hypothetical protein